MIEDPKKIVEAYRSGSLRKILLIRISRLGDLLFTTPALRALKACFPEAELHFLTNAYSRDALTANPYLKGIHLLDRKRLAWRLFRRAPVIPALRSEHFDLAIPFRMRKEYKSLFRKIGVPMLYTLQSPPEGMSESMHQADRYLKGLEPLGVEPDALGMDVFFSSMEEAKVMRFMEEHYPAGSPRVVFHAGCHQTAKAGPAGGTMKRTWPLQHWVDLVRQVRQSLNVPPTLVGFSPGDLAYNQEIAIRSEVACPGFRPETVGQMAALLRLSGAFVCVDTGPLHIASAAGVPTVALFGPSRPALTGPYRNRGGAVVIQKKIDCVPCKGKGIRCADNICMQQITPQEVMAALLERIRKPAALIRTKGSVACQGAAPLNAEDDPS
ncbi:MAG: glycosyltransferase family 9 protein [Planctomycetota bacterium]